jgi:uncharacterized protein YdhG (YjbR/CyaY superfamily)
MAKTDFKSVDEYIATFPAPVQEGLQSIRRVLRAAVPDGEEGISYQIPVMKFHGSVLFFSGWKDHYSIYPASESLLKEFPELANYQAGKGTLSFPFTGPLPLQLIHDVAVFRAEENLRKAAEKRRK